MDNRELIEVIKLLSVAEQNADLARSAVRKAVGGYHLPLASNVDAYLSQAHMWVWEALQGATEELTLRLAPEPTP